MCSLPCFSGFHYSTVGVQVPRMRTLGFHAGICSYGGDQVLFASGRVPSGLGRTITCLLLRLRATCRCRWAAYQVPVELEQAQSRDSAKHATTPMPKGPTLTSKVLRFPERMAETQPAPTNYPRITPKYHLLETTKAFNGGELRGAARLVDSLV